MFDGPTRPCILLAAYVCHMRILNYGLWEIVANFNPRESISLEQIKLQQNLFQPHNVGLRVRRAEQYTSSAARFTRF